MFIVFAAIILLFSSIALISSSMALLASNRIFYGISANGVPLGGLTREEAEAKLTQMYQRQFSGGFLLKITSGNLAWEIKPGDIDYAINIAATAQTAYGIGREENFIKRALARLESAHHGFNIDNAVSYDKHKLESIIHKIAAQVSQESQDAYCEVVDNKVVLRPEKNGVFLDVLPFIASLEKKLHDASLPDTIALPVTETAPGITKDHLQGIDTILSAYTSHFNQYNYNRSENIRIAANSINGVLIQPEQVISFNELVGLRIAAAGFKEAPVIVDGKTVPDIGGGVCQVSSTLYNAILLADMQPVERTPHFHPLGYAPIGLDATVADNLIDFKFKNSRPENVYISRQIHDGNLTIYILGGAKLKDDTVITLSSTIDKTIPPPRKIEYDTSLPAGKTIVKEEGLSGYIVSSYRIKTKNGKEISRELLYVDNYQAEPEIIVVGKKRPPAPKAPAPAPAPKSK